MKNHFYNVNYFLMEVKTIIRLNIVSNVFSLFSIALIFFILAMVISGWWVSNQVVQAIQEEAEINIYYSETIGNDGMSQLLASVKGIKGVREARVVDEGEAYDRMAEILGKEARVLEFFDDNPFSSFIEVKIQLEQIDSVLKQLGAVTDIEHVRDNRDVLDRLGNIAGTLSILGYVVVAAVGISTLVIISHIIRQGIYDNREQINTLRLLGAPETFIASPFLLEGLLLTLGGGMLGAALAAFALKQIYAQMAGPLPFIPLPPLEALVWDTVTLMIILSTFMGIGGSLFGLSSAKKN